MFDLLATRYWKSLIVCIPDDPSTSGCPPVTTINDVERSILQNSLEQVVFVKMRL